MRNRAAAAPHFFEEVRSTCYAFAHQRWFACASDLLDLSCCVNAHQVVRKCAPADAHLRNRWCAIYPGRCVQRSPPNHAPPIPPHMLGACFPRRTSRYVPCTRRPGSWPRVDCAPRNRCSSGAHHLMRRCAPAGAQCAPTATYETRKCAPARIRHLSGYQSAHD